MSAVSLGVLEKREAFQKNRYERVTLFLRKKDKYKHETMIEMIEMIEIDR